MNAQRMVELQARRATAKATLAADSHKVTANIAHAVGPPLPPDDLPGAPDTGCDIAELLPLLIGRPGKRTIIVVEEQG